MIAEKELSDRNDRSDNDRGDGFHVKFGFRMIVEAVTSPLRPSSSA